MANKEPSRGLDPVKQELLESVDIDENVACFFPPGATLNFALPHGASFWTRTAKIVLELEDGSPYSLFLKVARDDLGLGVVKGEFEAVKSLYALAPDFLPRPIATGTYKSEPNTHFMLSEFVDMIDELPDMQSFCSLLAKMHQDSIPTSKDGKFGFHVVTYNGSKARDVRWCDTWEQLFTQLLRRRVQQEQATQGPSQEMDTLLTSIYDKIIPRLLGPLAHGPNKIKPVLVHGDVWFGNMGINVATGEPIVFDAATIWAHNELDVANMALTRYRMGAAWTREYHKHFPISAPAEDYPDRILLYQIHSALCGSSLFPNTTIYREEVLGNMRKIVGKYDKDNLPEAKL